MPEIRNPGLSRDPHASVQGPALVQAIRGELTLHASNESWTLGHGGLRYIVPGLDHSVETTRGCVMLVVVQNAGELHLFGSDAPIWCGVRPRPEALLQPTSLPSHRHRMSSTKDRSFRRRGSLVYIVTC